MLHTRGKSLTDYSLCDKSFYEGLDSFDLEPLGTNSDHRPLVFSINMYDMKKSWSQTQTPSQNKTSRYYKYIRVVHNQQSLKIEAWGIPCCDKYSTRNIHTKFQEKAMTYEGCSKPVKFLMYFLIRKSAFLLITQKQTNPRA